MASKTPGAIYDRRWRQEHKQWARYCNYRSEAKAFLKIAKRDDLRKWISLAVNYYGKRFLGDE